MGRSFYHDFEKEYHHEDDCCCPQDCVEDKCHCHCHDHHDHGSLVEKVICSKDVLTSAELALPFAVEAGTPGSPVYDFIAGLGIADGLQVNVIPDYARIRQEVTPLDDAVMIFGTLPVTVNATSTVTPAPAGLPLNFTVQIYFQEIVDCPGVCPDDRVVPTRPKIIKEINQPLLANGPNGGLVANLLLYKAVIRTSVTVIRRGIKKRGKFCDLDSHHYVPTREINTPYQLTPLTSPLVLPGGGAGGGAGGGGTFPPSTV